LEEAGVGAKQVTLVIVAAIGEGEESVTRVANPVEFA